eukprot:1162166-Amphidinium_carterae.1
MQSGKKRKRWQKRTKEKAKAKARMRKVARTRRRGKTRRKEAKTKILLDMRRKRTSFSRVWTRAGETKNLPGKVWVAAGETVMPEGLTSASAGSSGVPATPMGVEMRMGDDQPMGDGIRCLPARAQDRAKRTEFTPTKKKTKCRGSC